MKKELEESETIENLIYIYFLNHETKTKQNDMVRDLSWRSTLDPVRINKGEVVLPSGYDGSRATDFCTK